VLNSALREDDFREDERSRSSSSNVTSVNQELVTTLDMEVIFRDFKQAQLIGSGPLLSTITPIPLPTDPDRLNNFYRGSSSFSIQSDVRYGILHHANTDVRFLRPRVLHGLKSTSHTGKRSERS
jgi:hypothetical protein